MVESEEVARDEETGKRQVPWHLGPLGPSRGTVPARAPIELR